MKKLNRNSLSFRRGTKSPAALSGTLPGETLHVTSPHPAPLNVEKESGRSHNEQNKSGEVRKLKVLTLGWEFPPLYAGGLGPACYGLTKALSRHVEQTIILPRSGVRLCRCQSSNHTRQKWTPLWRGKPLAPGIHKHGYSRNPHEPERLPHNCFSRL